MHRPPFDLEIAPEKERELVAAIAKNFQIQAPTPGGTGKSGHIFGELEVNGYIYTSALERLSNKLCELEESFYILVETLGDICKQKPELYGNAYGLTMNHFSTRGMITSESDTALLQPMIDSRIDRMNTIMIDAIGKSKRGKNDIEQLARLRECRYP